MAIIKGTINKTSLTYVFSIREMKEAVLVGVFCAASTSLMILAKTVSSLFFVTEIVRGLP